MNRFLGPHSVLVSPWLGGCLADIVKLGFGLGLACMAVVGCGEGLCRGHARPLVRRSRGLQCIVAQLCLSKTPSCLPLSFRAPTQAIPLIAGLVRSTSRGSADCLQIVLPEPSQRLRASAQERSAHSNVEWHRGRWMCVYCGSSCGCTQLPHTWQHQEIWPGDDVYVMAGAILRGGPRQASATESGSTGTTWSACSWGLADGSLVA